MEKLKFEECKNCRDWTGCITDCLNTCGKPLDALEEFNKYKDLDEQRKLLKLPAAIGDVINGGKLWNRQKLIGATAHGIQ